MSRPSFGRAWENWRRSDDPLPTKVRLALRNNARKWMRRRPCCGNHGEPGC